MLEAELLWQGSREIDEVVLKEVDLSMKINDELEQRIKASEEKIKNDPEKYDGKLWGYNNHKSSQNKLIIRASPITYSMHVAMRGELGLGNSSVLPIGVNTLQETIEGDIVLGYIPEGSDHPGLVLAGSTFIKRKEEDIKRAAIRGCVKKVGINQEYMEKTIKESDVIGIVSDPFYDIGILIQFPSLNLTKKELENNNDFYEKVVFLHSQTKAIEEVLKTRKYEGMPATNQLLGSLKAYISQGE